MHPSESDLALYAGGELGLWSRLRVRRHMVRCGACYRQIEELHAVREWMQTQDQLPLEINWGPLAAELKANIRLGLAAGECVGPAARERAPIPWRAAVVLPVLLLVLIGWWLQSWPRPALRAPRAPAPATLVVRASPGEIEVEQNGEAFALLHPGATDVTFSVSGQGARARYVDAETGYVTISHVYAQ
jgi:hypothetical protein